MIPRHQIRWDVFSFIGRVRPESGCYAILPVTELPVTGTTILKTA